jgi:hypothetical protein
MGENDEIQIFNRVRIKLFVGLRSMKKKCPIFLNLLNVVQMFVQHV